MLKLYKKRTPLLCVFDCETIPDAALIRQKFGFEGSDEEVSLQALQFQEEKSGSSFLPLPFHKVVAISAVIADEFGHFKKVSSIEGEDEEEMIQNFLHFIDKKNPRLVSFNGRSFDIPMLMLRALKYHLSCPAYFEQDNQALNKTKWDNYRSRYSENFHLDLMDVLSHYGATRGLSLDTLCQMSGIPGKFDISGDQVMRLYYEGKRKEIKEYCESDVINTYLLFLRYEILKGALSKEEYLNILDKMRSNFPQNRSYSLPFLEFFSKEIGWS